MKAHNWEVDIGLMLEIYNSVNANIGCRWEGRSNYLSDIQVFQTMTYYHQKYAFLSLCGIFNHKF